MSGEDEEGEEREGSRSLRRLVMKALVEKRDTERVPQLDGALYLQLLLMMRLHCRDETKWGGDGRVHGFRGCPTCVFKTKLTCLPCWRQFRLDVIISFVHFGHEEKLHSSEIWFLKKRRETTALVLLQSLSVDITRLLQTEWDKSRASLTKFTSF